ncbi:MAG: glycosyltransferase family 2 protein [Alphaproteobacteria bacterium]|nr:glycosyltransferase family 2 protein [Alphaproteobacteria bacterium]
MTKKIVSVVFSFRNEAANLPALIDRMQTVMGAQPEDYELIFVNDDSSDISLDILKAAHKGNPRVKILNMSRRFGVSECVLAGMAAARGDAVVYLDTDLQDPPELIPKLLERWRNGVDVVNTVRTARLGETKFKKFVTRLAYGLIGFASDTKLITEAGDFKLVSRRALDHLLSLKEHDPYLRGLISWVGFTQVTVPYEREARFGGVTKFPLHSRGPWKMFAIGLTSFSFMPIYGIFAVAVLGLVAVGVLGLTSAGLALAGRESASAIGFLALLTFFWATLMASVAVVGIYVARTYKEARGRPRYIVRDRIGFEAAPESGDADAPAS